MNNVKSDNECMHAHTYKQNSHINTSKWTKYWKLLKTLSKQLNIIKMGSTLWLSNEQSNSFTNIATIAITVF